MNRFSRIFLTLILVSLSVSSFAAWHYHGEIALPTSSPDCRWPIVMTADDSRDILYIGMFNDSGASVARGVTRVALSDSKTATFTEIHSRTADNGRGFCGLAYDSDADVLYVTGDSSTGVSYIDKITSPGTSPAVSQNWATPSFRTVGCALDEVAGVKYLMVAELVGGKVHAYKASDGSLDSTAATLSDNYCRGIAVNPTNNNIYCNRNGNLQEISGGSPANMAGYGTGSDIIAGTHPDVMQFASACYISYNDVDGVPEIVWNNADTGGSGGDTIVVTYLDGSPAKDETLYPTGSSNSTSWNFASDSAVLNIGGKSYLYVLDLSDTAPRLVIFSNDASVSSWEKY